MWSRFGGGGRGRYLWHSTPSRPAGLVSGSLKFLLSSLHFSFPKPQFLPQAACWLMSTCADSPPLFHLHSFSLHSLSPCCRAHCFLCESGSFYSLWLPCVSLSVAHSLNKRSSLLSLLHPHVITMNSLWWHRSRQSSSSLIFASFQPPSPFPPPFPTFYFFLQLTFLFSVSAPLLSSVACKAVFSGVSLLFKSKLMKQTK